METGSHVEHIKYKATQILASIKNKNIHPTDTFIQFTPILDNTALLGRAVDFAGPRIVIGFNGEYLLGLEHTLLESTYDPIEQSFSISINKLVEAYQNGVRTEYTNVGFVNFFPDNWSNIRLGINNNDEPIIWQHGKKAAHPNLYLQKDKNNPEMIENVIEQIQSNNVWIHNIIDEKTSLPELKTILSQYKYEIINRFMKQDFVEKEAIQNDVTLYPPHVLIIKEIYPLLDVKQYKDTEELNLKYRILDFLKDLAIRTPSSKISILLYTNYPNKAVLPNNVSMHFATLEDIKND